MIEYFYQNGRRYAMKVNVSISTDVLDWVIATIKPGVHPPKVMDTLYAWKSGQKTPTYNQVESVSKATGIPFGYFFLKTPPKEDLSFVEYRTVDSIELANPSRELVDIMHDMKMIQDWVKTYLVEEGERITPFVNSINTNESIEIFSTKVRLLLGLERDWYIQFTCAEDSFRFLRERMSDIGVIVMMSGIVGNNTHRALDTNEFRAFALVDTEAPLIFINTNDSINGKLFSLLHEFAHICLGENSLFNDRYNIANQVSKTEVLCNALAAEILVPMDEFKIKWESVNDQDDIENNIQTLAKRFNCGTTVIARRALDNNYIDQKTYNSIAKLAVNKYLENKKKKSGGGDFYRTAASRIDKRFLGMLIGSVAQGKTLYTDAFRLTNTNRTTFTILVNKMGVAFNGE